MNARYIPYTKIQYVPWVNTSTISTLRRKNIRAVNICANSTHTIRIDGALHCYSEFGLMKPLLRPPEGWSAIQCIYILQFVCIQSYCDLCMRTEEYHMYWTQYNLLYTVRIVRFNTNTTTIEQFNCFLFCCCCSYLVQANQTQYRIKSNRIAPYRTK